jgi:hypothetical protein
MIDQIATATALSAGSKTSVFGQPVTFTATVKAVAPAAGPPNGIVTFSAGGTILGTGVLSSGVASFTTGALAVGGHAITASYGGSTSFKISSGGLKHTVKRAATSMALTVAVNPAVAGQPVTFTATVTAVTPSVGMPTGGVTFKDGGKVLGSALLIGGRASFVVLLPSAGSRKITASYDGDSSFDAGVSAVLKEVVTTVSAAVPPPRRPSS